jgi:hypothetical protein
MIMEMMPPQRPEILADKLRVTKWDCMDFPEDLPAGHKMKHEMFQDQFSYPLARKNIKNSKNVKMN